MSPNGINRFDAVLPLLCRERYHGLFLMQFYLVFMALRGTKAPTSEGSHKGVISFIMNKKTIQYVLVERPLMTKRGERQTMQVARATGRRRVNFRTFCERVGKSTSFTWQEVGAILNFATEVAKDIVSEGDIVEFGDLGTLRPSFKSKAIPKGETFRVQEHILSSKVSFMPNRKYFALDVTSYEQVKTQKELKAEAGRSTKPKAEDSTEEDNII